MNVDLVLLVLRLVVAAAGLVLLVIGTRIAVTRRLPRPRLGRPGSNGQRHPVRIGGVCATGGAALLIQQASSLLPVPRPAGIVMKLVALVVLLAGLAWFLHRRD